MNVIGPHECRPGLAHSHLFSSQCLRVTLSTWIVTTSYVHVGVPTPPPSVSPPHCGCPRLAPRESCRSPCEPFSPATGGEPLTDWMAGRSQQWGRRRLAQCGFVTPSSPVVCSQCAWTDVPSSPSDCYTSGPVRTLSPAPAVCGDGPTASLSCVLSEGQVS